LKGNDREYLCKWRSVRYSAIYYFMQRGSFFREAEDSHVQLSYYSLKELLKEAGIEILNQDLVNKYLMIEELNR